MLRLGCFRKRFDAHIVAGFDEDLLDARCEFVAPASLIVPPERSR